MGKAPCNFPYPDDCDGHDAEGNPAMGKPVLKLSLVIRASSWADIAEQLVEIAEDTEAMAVERGEFQKWSTMGTKENVRDYGQHGHVVWLTPPERRGV